MAVISSGRKPKNTAVVEQKKEVIKKRRPDTADITATVCAVLCAACLIAWSASPKSSDIVAAAAIYDSTETEEKGFWDYFSEAIAAAFGYSG